MSKREKSADPTTGYTDMQWFMHGQRNVAFFGAFTRRDLSAADLLAAARGLVHLAPQLRGGMPGAVGEPLPDDLLARLIQSDAVDSLEGFPDRWFDSGAAMFAEPQLPFFRLRYAAARTPSADCRHGFLLVQVAHALVEGADSALLSRSQSAAHPHTQSEEPTPPLVKAAARAIGAVLASLHLIAGNLVAIRPGPYAYASRVYPRDLFSGFARALGVRQRALFYALAMQTVFDVDGPRRRRAISSTYSVIDEGGGAGRDSFMRMRMLFAVFHPAGDFAAFARGVDLELARSEAKESGFNSQMNAGGIRAHRALSRVLPFAYPPKLFQFMPYDVVLGLIPPHRLAGAHARFDGTGLCRGRARGLKRLCYRSQPALRKFQFLYSGQALAPDFAARCGARAAHLPFICGALGRLVRSSHGLTSWLKRG
jgi:hypothetical protein